MLRPNPEPRRRAAPPRSPPPAAARGGELPLLRRPVPAGLQRHAHPRRRHRPGGRLGRKRRAVSRRVSRRRGPSPETNCSFFTSSIVAVAILITSLIPSVLSISAENCAFSNRREIDPGIEFRFQEVPMGGAALDAVGVPLPEETLSAAKDSDAVLLGAIGGSVWIPCLTSFMRCLQQDQRQGSGLSSPTGL